MSGVARSDRSFFVALAVCAVAYVGLLLGMLAADLAYVVNDPQRPGAFARVLANPDIRYAARLTFATCGITTVLSLLTALPVSYLLSRRRFPGAAVVDAVVDAPIVLPPLAVGVSLLILFQYAPERLRDSVVFQIPAIVLAQYVVSCSLAIRTLRAGFDQLDARREQVALTLGATRWQALSWVVTPEIAPTLLTAGALAWARAMGEFGPILVFAGATRGKTEVLSTTVFLELSVGDLHSAVAVSLMMIAAALAVLVIARAWGAKVTKL